MTEGALTNVVIVGRDIDLWLSACAPERRCVSPVWA